MGVLDCQPSGSGTFAPALPRVVKVSLPERDALLADMEAASSANRRAASWRASSAFIGMSRLVPIWKASLTASPLLSVAPSDSLSASELESALAFLLPAPLSGPEAAPAARLGSVPAGTSFADSISV